jgi:hypothetical protein
MSRSLVAALALLLAGCASTAPVGVSASTAPSPSTLMGETKAMFGANISSWATVDAANALQEVGLTVAAGAVDDAPTGADAKPSSVEVIMPERVRKETFLHHVSIDWNPSGHEPGPVYGLPHFDYHFYNPTSGEVALTDCKDTTPVPAARIPQGYALLPPPNGQCVPSMGIHASDLSSPELAQTNPAKFTKTMILGYYAGAMTFIEPMFTKEYLQTKEAFTLNVPTPAELGKATLLPTSFAGSYDDKTKAYAFVFKGFKAAK